MVFELTWLLSGIASTSEEENIANLQPHILTEQINTNVIGTHLVTQAASPLFDSGTKIINISSMVASFAVTHSFPIQSVPSYSISKAALNSACFSYSSSIEEV
jgi:NAD(P)-dependent dehydrogenase (short-subunit alcohol dehydrogenase family)